MAPPLLSGSAWKTLWLMYHFPKYFVLNSWHSDRHELTLRNICFRTGSDERYLTLSQR